MSKFRKLIAFGIAAAMLLPMAACKNQSGTKDDTKSSKPVKISWYYWNTAVPSGQSAVNEALTKYVQETLKMNVTIDFECLTSANYGTQISTMMAAHEPFDISYTAGNSGYYSNSRQGAYYELTEEKLKKYAPDALKACGQSLLDLHKVDGKLYGLPTIKDTCQTWGFLLNKALVDKYNFDIKSLKSINDLTPILAVIKEKEPNIYPYFANSSNDPRTICQFCSTAGSLASYPGVVYANNDSGNTKILDQFETTEYKNYLRIMRSWFKAGYISTDNSSNVSTGRQQGKVFAQLMQNKPGNDKEKSNDKVTWVQIDLTKPQRTMGDIAASISAISSTSQNPDVALKVLNVAYKDQKFMDMLIYGIEGTNYTRVSDKVVKTIAGTNYDNSAMSYMFGNQFVESVKDNEDPNKWENIKKFNDSAETLNSAGFNFDTTSVTSEMAALKNVTSQYVAILTTGQGDPDQYLPEFITKLKANGLDKVIQAQQTQYDAFLKAKKSTK